MRALLTVLATSGLLSGCAASPRARTAPATDLPAAAATATTAALPPTTMTEPYALPAETSTAFTNYFTVKGGAIIPAESDLDPGYLVNASFGQYLTRLISVEIEGGYMAPDPDATSADLFAVPLMVNGRVNVPIWIFEVYGGAGIGGMYYDLDVGAVDLDGWLIAGNAFLGADAALFDKLTLGLEAKYYITEEIDRADSNLDGLAVMATLGWRF